MDQTPILVRLQNAMKTVSWEPWLLVVAGVFMAHLSWLRWPDLVIDFGEQAYIAWRLSEGSVLYRDIVYFYGPLSSYVHALLFKIFGPQLIVLIVFNIFLIAVLTLSIYRLFLFIGSRLSALMAGMTFLMVFAFAQYLWMGNHNFICSYVYDVTHGMVLSFLAAGQFMKFSVTRRTLNLILLGLLSGLVLLTKIEVSLAWTAAVFAGLAFLFKSWQMKPGTIGKMAALFLVPGLLPFILFTVYFASQMGFSAGLQAMLGPWTYVFSTSIGSLAFYRSVMGIDAWGENLGLMVLYLAAWAILLALLASLHHAFRKTFSRSPLTAVLTIVLFILGLQMYQSHIPWFQLLRPLPLILLGAVGFCGIRLWQIKNDSKNPVPLLTLFTLALFALILLIKILFNTHVYHYGTVLALPATLLFFKFLIDDLPPRIKQWSGEHLFFKGAVVGGLGFFMFVHFLVSAGYYAKKIFPVASGGDTVISYGPKITPRALYFQIALDLLSERMKEGDTLAALPTGTLLNYFARKENPITSISYNPGTEKLLGEERVLAELKAAPPTYIALVYHDFLEFGDRFFGKDFGKEIYQWILKDYVSFKLIGKNPVDGQGFGIHLFQLKTNVTAIP